MCRMCVYIRVYEHRCSAQGGQENASDHHRAGVISGLEKLDIGIRNQAWSSATTASA